MFPNGRTSRSHWTVNTRPARDGLIPLQDAADMHIGKLFTTQRSQPNHCSTTGINNGSVLKRGGKLATTILLPFYDPLSGESALEGQTILDFAEADIMGRQ